MNLKCILFGHLYDVKNDNKTIYCIRENKTLAVAKKGYAWELSFILSNQRYRIFIHVLLFIIVILVGFRMLGGMK